MLNDRPMLLKDLLSQLAILGATSIELRGGRRVELVELDLRSDLRAAQRHFLLRPVEEGVDVVDAVTGRLFGRAATVWTLQLLPLLAIGA
jgi:hypothetical protein